MNPLPALDPALAVSYRRVSSKGQEDGYGLPAQRTDNRRFARAAGLRIVDDVAETAHSTTPLDERSGGQAALDAMLRHGAGTLLIGRRDRLARDPYVAGHAKRAVALMGGRILFASGDNGDDDDSLFMGDIKDAVNAHERRMIVARLRRGREEKAAAHPHSRAQGGKVPYGYVRTPTGLVVEPEAAANVQRIFDLVRDGKSLRKVAAILSDETGREWTATTIAGIVRRDIYKRQQPGRIVDSRIWGPANRALDSRRKHAAF